MIHTLHQSVTGCTFRETLLVTYLIASHMFKVTTLIVVKTYLKQLMFSLVEDCVMNAINSNYVIIKRFVH